MEIGKLIEVEVRELWKHEQYDFSNWLAKEENIEYLNDAIGLTLIDISREVYVGGYRCDLYAVDETTGTKVIIENQLSSTNHDHLGKLITYASGLDAEVIVWIVKEAREEHRSAVEWLNNNTKKNISFFLIEIHAYRIGDSLPAPNFKIIEEPNVFYMNTVNSISTDAELSKAQSERLYFWNEFNQILLERNKPFNVRKASSDHWYDVAIGTSEAHISITLVNKENRIAIEIYISNNKQLFDELFEAKDEIEQQLGFEMKWLRLNERKASRILTHIEGLNFNNHSNYQELMDEVIDKVLTIRSVFKTYL